MLGLLKSGIEHFRIAACRKRVRGQSRAGRHAVLGPLECWICGGHSDKMSREHKFKATDVRAMFGREAMCVVSEGPSVRIKDAQGSKSDALKFKSKICSKCNGAVTQDSDDRYTTLSKMVQTRSKDGRLEAEFDQVFAFCLEPQNNLSISRYFAKLLGCKLADQAAPIPRSLSSLVRGESSNNLLTYRLVPNYDHKGDWPLLAHSGLGAICSKAGLVRRYASFQTVGCLSVEYDYHLTLLEALEIEVFFKDYSSEIRALSA